MKTLALVSFLPFIGSLLIACSASEDGAAAPPSAATAVAAGDTTQAPGGAAGEKPGAAPDALPAACAAYFDALAARKDRCGPGRDMLNLDSFEGARKSALARCIQQGNNEGTGYTPAFYAKCSATLTAAACDDDDAIVKACWEPRGFLFRGLGCATDDQCADGYCKLADGARRGSTCGKCDVPVWGKEGEQCVYGGAPEKSKKCLPGLTCGMSCRSPREATGNLLGESCGTTTYDNCDRGLSCSAGKCVPSPIAHVGEACVTNAKVCEEGSTCISLTPTNRVCMKTAALGEPCDPANSDGGRPNCDGWLECSPTHRCELPIILECK